MYVTGKKMAFAGILMALTVLLIVLSGVLQFNTLFLLAAASFLVGIIIRESSLRLGFAFYVGAVLLGLILAPDKFHCITFAAMGFYVFAAEFTYVQLGKLSPNATGRKLFWILKYVIFNILFIPMLFLFPKLLFAGEINGGFLLGAFLVGQIVLFIFDRAYEYFQVHVWGSFRKQIGFKL